jgi:hypothetical protein
LLSSIHRAFSETEPTPSVPLCRPFSRARFFSSALFCHIPSHNIRSSPCRTFFTSSCRSRLSHILYTRPSTHACSSLSFSNAELVFPLTRIMTLTTFLHLRLESSVALRSDGCVSIAFRGVLSIPGCTFNGPKCMTEQAYMLTSKPRWLAPRTDVQNLMYAKDRRGRRDRRRQSAMQIDRGERA